ncbi:hypothetical protein [Caulobacter sp. FWC2]|uniref:hypothetical protein n=1 Tax=Caulobacter sp. FWC2 TaxID=69664 RepID=UPI000C15D3D6|nr:hypothetical protein [Caulobacter sp. FWC2]PIB91304.1 hypothetical protein CSW62_06765 [Caulobacter sp. FWC2]
MADGVTVAWVAGGCTLAGGVLVKILDMIATGRTASAKAPADMTHALADFQTALGTQTDLFIKALQSERQMLQGEIADLRHRVSELEAENQQCRGDTAQMRQHIESLEEHLRRKGIDIPKGARPRGLTVLSEGLTTVFTLDDPAKTPRPRRRKAAT